MCEKNLKICALWLFLNFLHKLACMYTTLKEEEVGDKNQSVNTHLCIYIYALLIFMN
jgi:hypothetical protein